MLKVHFTKQFLKLKNLTLENSSSVGDVDLWGKLESIPNWYE